MVCRLLCMGEEGGEQARDTALGSNRVAQTKIRHLEKQGNVLKSLARLTGIEPVAFGSGGQRSIQLSYRRTWISYVSTAPIVKKLFEDMFSETM